MLGMTKRVSGDAVKTSQLMEWLRQRAEEMAALLAPLRTRPGKIIALARIFLKTDCGNVASTVSAWKPVNRKMAWARVPSVWLLITDGESASSTFTGITMSFPHSRGSNFRLRAEAIFCLGAVPAT